MLVLIGSRNMMYNRLTIIMVAYICIDVFVRPQAVFGDPNAGMPAGERTDKSEGIYSFVLYYMFIIEFFSWAVFRDVDKAWHIDQADSKLKKYRYLYISLLTIIPGVLIGMLQAHVSWLIGFNEMILRETPSLVIDVLIVQFAVTILAVCLTPNVYIGTLVFIMGHIIGFLCTITLLQASNKVDTINFIPEYFGWILRIQLVLALVALAVRMSPHWLESFLLKLNESVKSG